MTIYYIETSFGCGLRDESKKSIIREEGTGNIQLIRPATQKDIAWVKVMGGYVPLSLRKEK